MSKKHDLKILPEFLADVVSGRKSFELRKNDRNFCVGDVLILREWDPVTELYTGRTASRCVRYVLRGPVYGLADGYVIMAID